MSRIPSVSPFSHRSDLFHSAGWVQGGTITDGGDQIISVTKGIGFIRIADDRRADIKYFNWDTTEDISVPTDASRLIIVRYNDGSPIVTSVTTDTELNFHNEFDLATVIDEGGTLHISDHQHRVVDATHKMIRRMHDTEHIRRGDEDTGLILGESGDDNQNITVSAGSLWISLNKNSIDAIDTSGTDTFDRYYTGWVKQADQTIWDNTNWDNAGSLDVINNNWWSTQYFYLETDGGLVSLYGQAQYATQAMAENDPLPTSVPDRLEQHGILIGRIIFQKGTTIPEEVESVFTMMFNIAGVTVHDNLSGVTSDQHHAQAHATDHTDGTDDIQDATDSQKGVATAAQITKLDGIASGANNYTHPNHSGDVTSVGDGVQTLATKFRTVVEPIYIEFPLDGDEYPICFIPNDAHLVEVAAVTDAGAVEFNIYRRQKFTPGSGTTTVLSSNMDADVSGETTGAFVASGVVAAHQWLVYKDQSGATGSPTKLWGFVEYTID